MNNMIIAQDGEHFTGSGVIVRGAALCAGYLIGTDSTNDPTIGLWNNSGTRLIIPTATYDASALGLGGASITWRHCSDGISLVVSCSGTVYIVPIWQAWISALQRDVG